MTMPSKINRIILEKEISVAIGDAISNIEKIERECQDPLQDCLISVGRKFKAGNYMQAMLKIGESKQIFGLDYLNGKADEICALNKLNPNNRTLAFSRQEDLADIWARHTSFHRDYVSPILERLMLITIDKAMNPTTRDDAIPSVTR